MASIKGIALEGSVAGAGRRVGIVRAKWNATVIDALVKGARDELLRCGVAEADIVEVQVRTPPPLSPPRWGAARLPVAVRAAA
jgi:6,7-dimethyl-8-ribityllumazine synthase